MAIGIATIICIASFVVCAFLLRLRMHSISVRYEAEIQTLLAAELALLSAGIHPEPHALELRIAQAERHARVMRANAGLFRLLWPHEYDRAFRAAQHLIAQSSRLAVLAAR